MSFEIITKAIEDHGHAVQQMKAELSQEIKSVSTRMFDLEQKAANGADHMEVQGFNNQANPIGSFVKSTQLENMRNGANTTGRVELKGGDITTLRKAMTSAAYDVQPQRATGLYNNPQVRLTILDLLPSLAVNNGKFEFMQLTGKANGAAVQVAEGDLKAESTPTFAVKEATISTIAHWTRASIQILDDAPALEQQLSSLMTYGVQAKLEAEVLNGDGSTGRMLGILPQATPFVDSGDTGLTPADRIGQAITALGAAGWVPGAIVMNHSDWFSIASMKATDSTYILGSPRDPGPANLWSVPVVLSAGIPAGTALVLDPAQLAVLDRQAPSVMASREDRDNFVTNQVTLLAELRAGLAVFAAGAVLKVTLNPA